MLWKGNKIEVILFGHKEVRWHTYSTKQRKRTSPQKDRNSEKVLFNLYQTFRQANIHGEQLINSLDGTIQQASSERLHDHDYAN